MKKLLALCAAVLLIAGLAACERRDKRPEPDPAEPEPEATTAATEPETETAAPTEVEEESEEEEPDAEGAEQAVHDLMAALQSGSRERIESHIDYKNMLQLREGQSDANFRQVLRRVCYEILDVDAGAKVARVETRISNIDLKGIMPQYFQKAGELEYNNALSEAPLSDEELEAEYERLFVELLDAAGDSTLSSTVTIQVLRTDGDWRVQSDETLRTAVTGDFWNASANVGENAH